MRAERLAIETLADVYQWSLEAMDVLAAFDLDDVRGPLAWVNDETYGWTREIRLRLELAKYGALSVLRDDPRERVMGQRDARELCDMYDGLSDAAMGYLDARAAMVVRNRPYSAQ